MDSRRAEVGEKGRRWLGGSSGDGSKLVEGLRPAPWHQDLAGDDGIVARNRRRWRGWNRDRYLVERWVLACADQPVGSGGDTAMAFGDRARNSRLCGTFEQRGANATACFDRLEVRPRLVGQFRGQVFDIPTAACRIDDGADQGLLAQDRLRVPGDPVTEFAGMTDARVERGNGDGVGAADGSRERGGRGPKHVHPRIVPRDHSVGGDRVDVHAPRSRDPSAGFDDPCPALACGPELGDAGELIGAHRDGELQLSGRRLDGQAFLDHGSEVPDASGQHRCNLLSVACSGVTERRAVDVVYGDAGHRVGCPYGERRRRGEAIVEAVGEPASTRQSGHGIDTETPRHLCRIVTPSLPQCHQGP